MRLTQAVVLLIGAAACAEPDAQARHVNEVVAAGGIVDSAIPLEERLRRFRTTVAEHPDTLRHASPSLAHLVERWADAVAANDTSALTGMMLDRAEFAWLFYADTRLARTPYEMPPAVLWEQMLANSNEGAKAVLARFGGRPLEVRAVRCPAPPDTEGANVIRRGCVARLRAGHDTVPEARWFGSIVERNGRFKLAGLSTGRGESVNR